MYKDTKFPTRAYKYHLHLIKMSDYKGSIVMYYNTLTRISSMKITEYRKKLNPRGCDRQEEVSLLTNTWWMQILLYYRSSLSRLARVGLGIPSRAPICFICAPINRVYILDSLSLLFHYIQGVTDHPYQSNISKTERGRQKYFRQKL